MKAVSLPQPWATLAALGVYPNITIGWKTDYVGPLAIHASNRYDRKVCDQPEFSHALRAANIHPNDTVLGAIIAVGHLYETRRTSEFGRSASMIFPNAIVIPESEFAFGDFAPGRWVIRVRDVVKLPVSIGIYGYSTIWDVPSEIAARIDCQLGREATA